MWANLICEEFVEDVGEPRKDMQMLVHQIWVECVEDA